jgi:hypothetical protein
MNIKAVPRLVRVRRILDLHLEGLRIFKEQCDVAELEYTKALQEENRGIIVVDSDEEEVKVVPVENPARQLPLAAPRQLLQEEELRTDRELVQQEFLERPRVGLNSMGVLEMLDTLEQFADRIATVGENWDLINE